MFKITNVIRVNDDTVMVSVSVDAKAWHRAKRTGGLGQLYGIDISNAVFRAYGVKAYQPSVSDRARAVGSLKHVQLYYRDADWKPVPDNVQRVSFGKRLTKASDQPGDLIKVDFVSRRRIA